ncbi:hypothetical protein [Pseudomonas purpurea]|uniref:hypothetical protein n=1 Tax=Pseudomonas purpurea TaxID=3136737 RepID=UPI0032659D2E
MLAPALLGSDNGRAVNVAVYRFVKIAFDKEYVAHNRSGDIIDVGAPRTLGLVLRYDL